MGGACSTHGGQERCIQGFGGRSEGKNHLEDPGVDDRILLKCIFKKWDGEVCTGLICLRIGTGNGRL